MKTKFEFFLIPVVIFLMGYIAFLIDSNSKEIRKNTLYNVTVNGKEYFCNDYKIIPIINAKGGNGLLIGGNAVSVGGEDYVQIILTGEKHSIKILETVTKNYSIKQIKFP